MEKFYDNQKSNLREKVLSTGDSSEVQEAFLEYIRSTPSKQFDRRKLY
ncbi:MAG: hypothetical protein KJ623_03050 [Nanoarchaeota archaeon]|nr:hypothetical protein [Nanoarchaeota archaeon]MBU0962382.1 hypothetical protein [Nanoarchaeota archaeon]